MILCIKLKTRSKWNKIFSSTHNESRFEGKELDDWGSCKNDYMHKLSTYDCECNKAGKIDEYLDIIMWLLRKTSNLKIRIGMWRWNIKYNWNLTKWEKISMCKKYCHIQTISFVIICLLLLPVICVSCYSYYAKHWPKQRHLLPFQDTNNWNFF